MTHRELVERLATHTYEFWRSADKNVIVSCKNRPGDEATQREVACSFYISRSRRVSRWEDSNAPSPENYSGVLPLNYTGSDFS